MAFSNPVISPISNNMFIDGLKWGRHWDDPGSATTTRLAIHIAGVGGVAENFDFGGVTVTGQTSAQAVAAWNLAMQLFESVCNIDFRVALNKFDADIILAETNNFDASGNLGVSVPPGEDTGPLASQQGGAIVNFETYATTNGSSLLQGGYDFITFIHELGHALGLKHPHDTGGGFFSAFPGVTSPFGDYGDFDLNQGIYTTMSYNDGWQTGPNGILLDQGIVDRGYQGTPMAFDIAALQALYGANMSYRTGNDTYTLASVNAPGTFYSCLWDAGGTDTIINTSALDSTLDLRAATLLRASGGGGYLSNVTGIDGGFTIAKGAVIENATGGSGADTIVGNQVANILLGNDGNDTITGGGGADRITGGIGTDTLTGSVGADKFIFTALTDSFGQIDLIKDFTVGVDDIFVNLIDANDLLAGNQAFVFRGTSAFTGAGGEIRYVVNTAGTATSILFSTDADAAAEMTIRLTGNIALTAGDFLL
jgi:serralysin